MLSNSSMPGLVKIGQSGSDPEKRASELFQTGVPTPFKVEYKGLFDNYESVERAVHNHLAEFRSSTSREFFKLAVSDAILAIRHSAYAKPKFEEIVAETEAEVEHARQRAEERKRIADEEEKKEAARLQAIRRQELDKIEARRLQGERKENYISDQAEMVSDGYARRAQTWSVSIAVVVILLLIAAGLLGFDSDFIVYLGFVIPVVYVYFLVRERKSRSDVKSSAEKKFGKTD